MRRLFFPFSGNSFFLDGDGFHHWVRVNRAQVGDEIEVADGLGKVVVARLAKIEENRGLLEVVRSVPDTSNSPLQLTLAFGLLKGEKIDWVIQKAVEIGVDSLIPLEMEHSVLRWDEKKKIDRQKRWQKIALEAAQQSGRERVPEVLEVQKLSAAVKNFAESGAIWVPHENCRGDSLKRALKAGMAKEKNMIIIGPEGGFSANETEFLKNAGANLVTLGDAILRAETAAILASGLMLYEWGLLGGQE
jgi:RNA methyltransferase, RsmE family